MTIVDDSNDGGLLSVRRSAEKVWVDKAVAVLDDNELSVLVRRITEARFEPGTRRRHLTLRLGDWLISELDHGAERWPRRNILAGVRNLLAERIDLHNRQIRACRSAISSLDLQLLDH